MIGFLLVALCLGIAGLVVVAPILLDDPFKGPPPGGVVAEAPTPDGPAAGLVLDFDQIRARIEADYTAPPEAVQALHDDPVTCRWGDIATMVKQANDLAGVVAALAAVDPLRPFSIYDDAHKVCRVCRTWFPLGRGQFLQPASHADWCPWARAMALYAEVAPHPPCPGCDPEVAPVADGGQQGATP